MVVVLLNFGFLKSLVIVIICSMSVSGCVVVFIMILIMGDYFVSVLGGSFYVFFGISRSISSRDVIIFVL